jgi:negative regulator of replication initiation
MNIFSDDYIFQQEVKRGIHHQMSLEAKKRVKEILYNFFMTRGDPLTILRKYFTIYERKANYLSLIENAKIIGEYCKRNLKKIKANKNWEKICKKLVIKEKIKIIKYSKILYTRLSKIFNLIRITRFYSIYSKRKFLHFIIVAWLAYTKTINQKRSHVKTLYENMLSTYMNMADDVFGANQKENPSVQDALYEAVDSNKFQTKEMKDVPLATEYYENRKDINKFNQSFSRIYGEENKSFEESKTSKSIVSNNSMGVNNIFFKSINETRNKNKNEGKYEMKTGFKNIITNRISQEKVILVKDEEKLKSKGRGRAFRTNSERDIINNYSSNISNYKKESIKYENDENGNNINNYSIKIEERKKNDDDEDEKSDTTDKNRMSYKERRKLFRLKLYENKK